MTLFALMQELRRSGIRVQKTHNGDLRLQPSRLVTDELRAAIAWWGEAFTQFCSPCTGCGRLEAQLLVAFSNGQVLCETCRMTAAESKRP